MALDLFLTMSQTLEERIEKPSVYSSGLTALASSRAMKGIFYGVSRGYGYLSLAIGAGIYIGIKTLGTIIRYAVRSMRRGYFSTKEAKREIWSSFDTRNYKNPFILGAFLSSFSYLTGL